MAQQQGLILLQPYLTLEAQHCQRIPQVGTGIAECYEFTIPANGQSQFPAVPDGSVDLVFGMSKQDVRLFIGGTVYRNALAKGIGVKLPLWDQPEMA